MPARLQSSLSLEFEETWKCLCGAPRPGLFHGLEGVVVGLEAGVP